MRRSAITVRRWDRRKSKIRTAKEPAASETVSGTVEAIENVVVSGNTCYYFTLTDDRTDSIYTAAITVSERLPFVQAGDSVSFECVENGSTKEVIPGGKITLKSEDMILKAAIVHILDSSVGIPVLSDQSMEVGPDFSDFLKAHIEKITESDDVKHCTFAEGSEVKDLLQNCTPDNFVETSKQLAERSTTS